MASIGAVTCTFVRGQARPKMVRLDLWESPGINGIGAQALGFGDSAAKLRAVFYSNEAGVEAWAGSLYALQGQVVTVINDFARVFPGVLLTRVGTVQKSAAVASGGITTRGEIEIECMAV